MRHETTHARPRLLVHVSTCAPSRAHDGAHTIMHTGIGSIKGGWRRLKTGARRRDHDPPPRGPEAARARTSGPCSSRSGRRNGMRSAWRWLASAGTASRRLSRPFEGARTEARDTEEGMGWGGSRACRTRQVAAGYFVTRISGSSTGIPGKFVRSARYSL